MQVLGKNHTQNQWEATTPCVCKFWHRNHMPKPRGTQGGACHRHQSGGNIGQKYSGYCMPTHPSSMTPQGRMLCIFYVVRPCLLKSIRHCLIEQAVHTPHPINAFAKSPPSGFMVTTLTPNTLAMSDTLTLSSNTSSPWRRQLEGSTNTSPNGRPFS